MIWKNWLSQNAAGSVCKETPLGLDRLREERAEKREGRGGHHQKELAHAQYWKSAIHSLSTALLLSLLSFTLTTVSDKVKQRGKLSEFVQYVCGKMIGWTESGGDHCSAAWQAHQANMVNTHAAITVKTGQVRREKGLKKSDFNLLWVQYTDTLRKHEVALAKY